MKQLLLLITLITITTISFSQLNKNQFLIGGNASFSSSKYGGGSPLEYKLTSTQIAPNAGFFILSKLAVGGKVSLGYEKYKSSYTTNSNSTQLLPYVRYYILSPKQKVNLFTEVDYNYTISKWKGMSGEVLQVNKIKEAGYTIMAGPVFFISPSIAIELSLSFTSSKAKGSPYFTDTFMTGLGFQVHLGKNKKAE